MFETLDKMMLASVGAVSMTRDKAEKIFDEYVKRGQAEKGAKSGFVKDIMDMAQKNRENLENIVSEQVNATIKKLDLANKDDISRLERKIDQIKRQTREE